MSATLVVTLIITVVFWRPFFVLCLDEEKAEVLGLHAAAAHRTMLLLIALAMVTSFQAVGTLLVFGMLLAPAATGALLVHRLLPAMVIATVVGWISVLGGLLISYHFDLAASSVIVVVAVVSSSLPCCFDHWYTPVTRSRRVSHDGRRGCRHRRG